MKKRRKLSLFDKILIGVAGIIFICAMAILIPTEIRLRDFYPDWVRVCVDQEAELTLMGRHHPSWQKWSSSDETIATVSQSGVVTGHAAGQVVITLKEGPLTYRKEVTVTNHEMISAGCLWPEHCAFCDYVSPEPPKGHDADPATCSLDSVCKVCQTILQHAKGHIYVDATCEEAAVCTVCGEIGEAAKGHTFAEPTCEQGAYCVECGAPGEEEALGHSFSEPDCINPAICERCGIEEGEPLGHKEGKVVCSKPTLCERCGEVVREAGEHDFKPATCTKPATCKNCKATEGAALGHDADPATCTTPSVCKVCGKTVQNTIAHTFVDSNGKKICAYCGLEQVQTVTAATSDNASFVSQVVALVNAERANYGIAPVVEDSTLNAAAAIRSNECVTSFSHTRPNGTECFTVIDEVGASFGWLGENIAAGHRTPEEVVQGWMNSEGHRANILNPVYTHIGVGYTYTGSGYRHYWAQIFGA